MENCGKELQSSGSENKEFFNIPFDFIKAFFNCAGKGNVFKEG